MLVFDARRLHGQILAALESLEDRERYIDALAYHAWEAKDAAKTLAYNERAGDAALEQRALAEAASCFERAREAATDDDDRARLAERVGTVASLQGRLARAVDAFEIAYAIRLRRDEFDAAATILCAGMIDRNNLGDLQAAMLGQAFLQRHGHALAPAIRDRLLVNTARLIAAQYDFATADRLLSAISDPRSLVPRAFSNYLVTSLERNFYYGEAARWRALVPDFLENLTRIASPLQVIGHYTLVQMASHMGANDLAEQALLAAQRLERDAGYGASPCTAMRFVRRTISSGDVWSSRGSTSSGRSNGPISRALR
jgi:hypothetical protein